MTSCKNHPLSPADYLCTGCNLNFCADCVPTRLTGNFHTSVCPACGAQCIASALQDVALKPEDLTEKEEDPPKPEIKASGKPAISSSAANAEGSIAALATAEINLKDFEPKENSDASAVSLQKKLSLKNCFFLALLQPSRALKKFDQTVSGSKKIPSSLLKFLGGMAGMAFLLTGVQIFRIPQGPSLLTAVIGLGITLVVFPLLMATGIHFYAPTKSFRNMFLCFAAYHGMFVCLQRFTSAVPIANQTTTMILGLFTGLLFWEAWFFFRGLTKGLDFRWTGSFLLVLFTILTTSLLQASLQKVL